MATIKFLRNIFLLFGVFQLISGSAIPMWEFLSRSEKMSHLYSTFAKQVSDYCKTKTDPRVQPVAQCKRDLLTYGLDQLQTMSNEHLDTMDPYQRDAHDLIWQAMMKDHPTASTPLSADQQQITSAILIATTGSTYERNPIFDDDKKTESSYAMEMETSFDQQYPTAAAQVIYEEPQNHIQHHEAQATNLDVSIADANPEINYLTGPMVIRVRPDGTPVEEDKLKPLPADDDREAMQIGRDKLPTAEQIADTFKQGHLLQPQQIKSNYRLPLNRH